MIPTEVPSDTDVDEVSREDLAGRWSILVDLYGEFQGAAGAYIVVAFIIAGIAIAGSYLGKIGSVGILLSAVLLISCLAISLYSYLWYRWIKKRERIVYSRMMKMDED